MELVNDLEPNLWKACAGCCSVQIPNVDSMVHYYPQGHAEQASSVPDFSTISNNIIQPYFLCRVVSVQLLANQDTDEVFSKIRLQPIDHHHHHPSSLSRVGIVRSPQGSSSDGGEGDENDLVSFTKVLTTSDANNGGGFSVPRFGAESVFPPLNYKAERPQQNISVRDVHGVNWVFRHIHRGTPLRHLLTTGWSKFVNHKKLVNGDSVVFIKNRIGELSVGIRRKVGVSENVDFGRWNYYQNVREEECRSGEIVGFPSPRNARGRVSAESVLEAVELAGRNREFEIVWYPRVGSTEFLVKAETVEESLNMCWSVGTVIKMAVETEDSTSRLTWYQGKISSFVAHHRPWHGSPWRVLEVTWDDHNALQNVKRVSPWQVQVITTACPPTKRLCVSQNAEFPLDGNGAFLFQTKGLTNSMMGNYIPFPAGMQGARHDPISGSGVNPVGNNTNHVLYPDHVSGNNISPESSSVATELTVGGILQSDNLSPNNQGSVHTFGKDLSSHLTYKSTKKAGSSPFNLFGKIVYIDLPAETESDGGGSTEVDVGTGNGETAGMINPDDLPVNNPCKNLLDRLEVQCQRVSSAEAFPL